MTEGRGIQRVRLRIDQERCIWSENCVAIAPSVFRMDPGKGATVIDARSVDEETLWLAAELCPTEAIILEDEDGNQLYP